jgi:hypothetical protein
MVKYKFNEGALIAELQSYIDGTYDGHYSKNKFQSTEFIIDCGHGEGFALGNCLKYVQRYGKKDGKNRKDLMKVLHYALIALHVHDEEQEIDFPEPDSMDFGANLSYGIGTSYTAENYTDEAIYNSPKVVYNGSIDSITPQQWNTMNQKHLNETKETK